MIVTVSPLRVTLYSGKFIAAGPRTTWPEVLNNDPWHVHSKIPPENCQLVAHP
jgi:hypothetical protein